MALDLEDPQLLLERAERHYAEFNEVISPRNEGGLWLYRSEPIGGDQFLHSVTLNKPLLPRLKPIVGDIANNLRHSLDQIAGAVARASLSDDELARLRRSISFPFPEDDGSITYQLSSKEPKLGDSYTNTFSKVWERHKVYEYYFRVIRIISNSSKHWQLEFVNAETLAVNHVSMHMDRKIVTIPRGHFQEHDRFEWKDVQAKGCRLAVRLRFNDIQPRPATVSAPPSPDSVFRCSISYVRDMIEEFASVH